MKAGLPEITRPASLTYSTSNDRVSGLWRGHYAVVNSVNIAIDRIPGIDMDTELRARLVNEAKFLRGLLYFNLVRQRPFFRKCTSPGRSGRKRPPKRGSDEQAVWL